MKLTKNKYVQLYVFQGAHNELINKFAQKYFWEDAYCELWELSMDDEKGFMHPIEINDTYWSTAEIYQALMLDIPENIIHDYRGYAYELADQGKEYVNLYTYYLQNK